METRDGPPVRRGLSGASRDDQARAPLNNRALRGRRRVDLLRRATKPSRTTRSTPYGLPKRRDGDEEV